MERCSFTTQSFGDSYIIGAEAGEEDALIKVNENFSQNLEIKYSNRDVGLVKWKPSIITRQDGFTRQLIMKPWPFLDSILILACMKHIIIFYSSLLFDN
jgi:hypothetical protein